jgi:hypothetical protein
MRTIVWEYGIQQPTEGRVEVSQQIWLGHQYYNDLIKEEHGRRVAIIQAQDAIAEIAAARLVFYKAREAHEALKKKKDDAKENKHLSPPSKEELAAADKARAKAKEKLNEEIKKENDVLKPIYKEIDKDYEVIFKKLYNKYSSMGLYWGNLLHIRQSFDQARKPPKNLPKKHSKKPRPWHERPKFRSWPPGCPPQGIVATQYQGGMAAEKIFEKGTLVQVEPLHPDAFNENLGRGERRKLQYATLRMRVASENRKPVWASWPMYMHRPFPEGAIVKWIKVIRTPWNQRWQFRWKVQFTLEVPETVEKRGRRIVAVNAGWRRIGDDELRVATWVDDAGEVGELRLGYQFRGRLEKANRIQGYRDKNRDKIKKVLLDAGVKCEKWLSKQRFHNLLKTGQLEGDALAALEKWAFRDKHLFWYERGLRRGARNYRREQYRLLARDLVKKYDYIVIENYDLRDIVEDPDREKQAAHQRVEGAPSTFRLIAQSAASSRGVTVIEGKSKQATQRCHLCGYDSPWNAAPKIMHTCAGCGETWDQDVNNAKNMIGAAKDLINSPGGVPKKQKRAPRWSKRHKKSSAETTVPSAS